MQTNREDVGISIRSALLSKGTKQKFSLFVLIIISLILIFIETLENKPLSFMRSFVKDTIYRGSLAVSSPSRAFTNITIFVSEHINLYDNYNQLKDENNKLKNNISSSDFLKLENTQLRKLIDEQMSSSSNLVSARVLLDKKSPYLNSFVINVGNNRNVKNGMAVLDGVNFIGRIVDVNFFSSRVLLASDLNSKIPVVVEPSGNHAILSGHGLDLPTLEYLPENYNVNDGDKIYTSGKADVFSPGIPIGEVKIIDKTNKVILFSDLNQTTFVNINLGDIRINK